ncbi:MAG: hypothetical protein U0169_02065 [Polyangiaceae bacterium]
MTMPTLDFISSPKAKSDGAFPRGTFVVGDTIALGKLPASVGQPHLTTVTLASAPGGSSATISAGEIVPDVPGVYTFRVSDADGTAAGSQTREAVVYPAAALTDSRISDKNGTNPLPPSTTRVAAPRTPEEIRFILMAIGNDARMTSTVAAALTTPAPLPPFATGNLRAFGA